MTRDEVFKRLEGVFADVFDREIKLTETTTAADVEDWDSMRQITLVGAIEDEFDVHFAIKDIVHLKNVGDMVNLIMAQVK